MMDDDCRIKSDIKQKFLLGLYNRILFIWPKSEISQDFDDIELAKNLPEGAVLVRLRGTMWTLFFRDDDGR